MKKIVVPVLAATALATMTIAPRPAHADPATTTAIVTAAITAIVTVVSLKCTDANKDEYLCIAGPPKPPAGTATVCGLVKCPTDPKTGKVQATLYSPKNFLEEKAIQVVQSYYPKLKAGKLNKEIKVASSNTN